MCGGGGSREPEVRYVGPSEDDMRRQEEALARYQEQSEAQAADFSAQLRTQMDQAQLQQQQFAQQYASRTSAAEEASQAAAASSYKTSAQMSEAPSTAQTTTAATKKKPKNTGLRISSAAGTSSAAGSGPNLAI